MEKICEACQVDDHGECNGFTGVVYTQTSYFGGEPVGPSEKIQEKCKCECTNALPGPKNALELVLMFHGGGAWTQSRRDRWKIITGRDDATTKAMCDHIRKALKGLTDGEEGTGKAVQETAGTQESPGAADQAP